MATRSSLPAGLMTCPPYEWPTENGWRTDPAYSAPYCRDVAFKCVEAVLRRHHLRQPEVPVSPCENMSRRAQIPWANTMLAFFTVAIVASPYGATIRHRDTPAPATTITLADRPRRSDRRSRREQSLDVGDARAARPSTFAAASAATELPEQIDEVGIGRRPVRQGH
jgi:hypothetical protein